MVNVRMNNGEAVIQMSGQTAQLLTEIGIGFGKALKGVLAECPDQKFKDHLVKTTFEIALEAMTKEEAE